MNTSSRTIVPSASICDLRNCFPKLRKLLEREGEVVLTEDGRARYRLILCPPAPNRVPAPVDYWARLTELQPEPMSAARAREVLSENRGDR